MRVYENEMYVEDLKAVRSLDLPWEKLNNRTVIISGATGQIGSFLIDVLFHDSLSDLHCKVYALCRNSDKFWKRFIKYKNRKSLKCLLYDAEKGFNFQNISHNSYVIHLASNTHPIEYAMDPVGTIVTNVVGTQKLLDFARICSAERFLFASSCEIYGENLGDTEYFDEDYCGYLDCNTVRACYPEGKRCGEALCQAYSHQYGIDFVTARLARVYGPTISDDDSRAVAQFIHSGLKKEQIPLKSEGQQDYSYLYIADAVSGLLTVLFKGEKGHAYNIAGKLCDIKLADLARLVADCTGVTVERHQPNAVESVGFSKATKAKLASNKLNSLGWSAKYPIAEGIRRTCSIMGRAFEKTVLFSSARPLGRCENITALYNTYDGAKKFITHKEFKNNPKWIAEDYDLMVDDDFGIGSKAPVLMISHGIISKTYGLTQPGAYLKQSDANKLLYAISSSDSDIVRKITAKEYGLPVDRILPYGMPRFDALVGKKKGDGNTVLSRYKKAYLYCPTFRDWVKGRKPEIDFEFIDRNLNDNEVFAVKMHMVTGLVDIGHYHHVIQLSPDEPTTPYLIDCDVLVTDFSSIVFDGHFLNKPVILFAKDTASYLKERGMCMSYPEDYASNYTENEAELVRLLQKREVTTKDVEIRERMTNGCDGYSSERIALLIRETLASLPTKTF